jgi:hypothetical protein
MILKTCLTHIPEHDSSTCPRFINSYNITTSVTMAANNVVALLGCMKYNMDFKK